MRKLGGLFAVTLALMLCFPVLTSADEIGAGPAYIDGHSDNGAYGMNNDGEQSWGIALHYDKDMKWVKKRLDGKLKFGAEPGMLYLYANWTKSHNLEETKCEPIEWEYPRYDSLDNNCYQGECSTRKYTDNESINSHILSGYFKFYVELYGKLRLFGLTGPAVELADDYQSFAVAAGGGIQYRFTKSLGASLTQYEIFSDPFDSYRRFDATVLSVDFIF